MIPGLLVFCIAAFAWGGVARAQKTPAPLPAPPTIAERARFELRSTFSPAAFLSVGFSSAINQWRDHPYEWGQGMAGYGRRFGYRFAQHAVARGINFGAGLLLGEDPRYFPSHRGRFWPRTRYAISHVFIAPVNGARERLAIARMAGHYGSALAASAWLPSRLNDPGDVMLRGTVSVGWDVARNVFLEFWPDLKKRLFRNRR